MNNQRQYRRYSIEKPRSVPQVSSFDFVVLELISFCCCFSSQRLTFSPRRSRPDNVRTRKWILESPSSSSSSSSFVSSSRRSSNLKSIRIVTTDQKRNEFLPKENPTTNSSKRKSNFNQINRKEKRNVVIYIVGIMFYKFGLEAFNGSIVSLATNRYDRDAFQTNSNAKTFEKVGLIVGLNQLFQCLGSIFLSPLMKSSSIRFVLFISIFCFALFSSLLLIIDASTGGRIRPTNFLPEHQHDFRYYGNYSTNLLIPIYCLTGFVYGVVELIRRIIPQNLVGNNEKKLQRIDSLVHIFYEISGVSGALLTGLVLIPRLGNNYSFIITPICFTFSGLIWFFIRLKQKRKTKTKRKFVEKKNKKKNFLLLIGKNLKNFFDSLIYGGKLIFSNRKYLWLFPCFPLTLYIHRYIENGLAPQIAQRYLSESSWSQIIVGGSNSGELVGAILFLVLNRFIRSPMICLRLDSIILLLCWIIQFYFPSPSNIRHAFLFALIYFPFGFGSSIDEISLNAFLQSKLPESDKKNPHLSPLGSVMSVLYSSYIILYAILNPLLGKYIDHINSTQGSIRPALLFTSSIQISIVSFIVFISTFIPKRSFRLNPRL